MTDKIEIDWADDGYQHASADVSADLREFTVQYGMDTISDPTSFRNVSARGNLTLFDDGKYSTSIVAPLTRAHLRTRHLCRITSVYSDGTTRRMWEGYLEPLQAQSTAHQDIVRGDLVGKLNSVYTDVFETPEAGWTGREVSWLIEHQAALGPTYVDTRRLTTDTVHWPTTEPDLTYQRNRIGFLNAVADYAGAYHWEDADGYYGFRDVIRLENEPAALDVTQDDYKIWAYSTRIIHSIELLRNVISFRGADWGPVEETDDDSIGEYGRQEWQTPPWWLQGRYDHGRTNLTVRAEPLTHVMLAFTRLQQSSEQRQKEVELLRPGVAFDLDIMTEDATIDAKYFCLGAQLIRQFDTAPILVVYAVDTTLPDFADNMVLGSGRVGRSTLGN